MYSTKQQVDNHVANILGRIKDENERNSRGYLCAKMYYGIREFDVAKRYLAGFLNVRENYAPAHKLMAQIQDGLDNPELAIAAYKRSLDFDERQRDVVVKICELYVKTGVDPERAKYWAERAEKMWPGHPVIFKLREKMVGKKDGGQEADADLESLITSELVKQPKNPELRAKLLRMYMDTGRINEAYTHGVEVEAKNPYPNSLPWCNVLLEVLEAYQKQSGSINGSFHQHLYTAHSRRVALSLQTAKVADIAEALYKFDQSLTSLKKDVVSGPAWEAFYQITQAQYMSYAGHLLLKRAQQDHISWTDATSMAALCYLASYSLSPPNLQTPWVVKANQEEKAKYNMWHDVACFMRAEAGHLLLSLCGGDGTKWASKIQAQWGTAQGRGKIYDAIFTMRHMKGNKDVSYFMTNDLVSTFKPTVPTEAQLKDDNRTAHLYNQSDLRSLVWLALHQHQPTDNLQPDYNYKVFADLQYETGTNLDTASPETLSQLDTQAFMYSTVHTVALRLAERYKRLRMSESQLRLLPLCFNEDLCSTEQAEWWETAYNLHNNKAREDLGRLRLVLQRGIETVRLIGNHGMPVSLVVHLARIFAARAQDAIAMSTVVNEGYLQDRAALYWTNAVEMLERLANNQMVWSPKKRLFNDEGGALGDAQIKEGLEEGRLFLAVYSMHNGQQEDAIQMFSQINSADASFHTAQIYRMMADESERPDDGEDSLQVALLTKARDALYLTLDRIRGERHHKLTSILPTEIDDVESKLNRLVSGAAAADRSIRPDEVVEGLPEPTRSILHGSESFINTSTPQKKALPRSPIVDQLPHTRPSPERLDAQMRSLTMSQEVLIKQLMEQNDELKKQNKIFSDEIRKNHEEIEKLKIKIEQALPTPATPASAIAAAPMTPIAPGSPAIHPAMRQAMPAPAAASPYYPYRPEYTDYAGAGTPHHPPPLGAAYSAHPHTYPIYAPPPPPSGLPSHYPYPPPPPHQQVAPPTAAMSGKSAAMPKMPGTPVGQPIPGSVPMPGTVPHHQEDEDENYYIYDEDEYDEDESATIINRPDPTSNNQAIPVVSAAGGVAAAAAAAAAAGFQIPDSQLIQDWPYGNNVNLEGKSTLTYSPSHPIPPPQPGYFPQIVAPPARPGVPTPTMYGSPVVPVPAAIGPGFFSSPERPSYTQRFQSPTHIPIPASQGANVVVGLPGQPTAALTPPKPGFLPSSSAAKIPPPNASLTTTGGVINPAGMPPASTAAAALTGGNIFIQGTPTTPASAGATAVTAVTSTPSAAAVVTPAAAATPATVATSSFGTKFIMTMPEGTPASTNLPASLTTPAFSFGVNDGTNPSFIDNPEEEEDDRLDGDDSYQGPDFEPIVPLPDEVEVVTGEEEEVVLFVARTKLFRFVEKEWKERGLGEIKVLHHKALGRVRIVMRREQVHKVCANHSLNPSMTINYKSPADKKVLSWQAMDFAEGESHEQFCAKFKTEDIAAEFKRAFEDGIKLSAQHPKKAVSKLATSAEKPVENLMDKFKPKAGSWTCEVCMVNNPGDVKACAACTTPRPGCEPEPEKKDAGPKVVMASGGGFSFSGSSTSSGFNFGGTATPAGAAASGAVPTTTTISSSSGFVFGSSSTGDGSTGFTNIFGTKPSSTGKPSIVFGSSGTTPAVITATTTASTTPAILPGKLSVTSSSGAESTTMTTAATTKPIFTFGSSSLSAGSSFKFGETKPAANSTTAGATPASDMLKSLASSAAKPSGTPNPKASLGGFTFSSTPVITPTEKKEEKPKIEEKKAELKPEEPKVSPFAGFSFGKSSSTPSFGSGFAFGSSGALDALGNKSESQKNLTTKSDTKTPWPTSTITTSSDSKTFSSVAASSVQGFSKKADFKGFSGAGQQVFGKSPQKGGDEGDDEEYEPDVDFKPIVPLPDLVEVLTGEEEEEQLFSERAKLFRHDPDLKQWKERGIGLIKILKHKVTNRCRLLMRREQVLKICCNVMISPDVVLQRMAMSDKAWCWTAQDYSDGEVKVEQLAVRFKTVDGAANFKDVFERAQKEKPVESANSSGQAVEKVLGSALAEASGIEFTATPAKPEVTSTTGTKSLQEMFKPKEGEWECEICMVKSTDPAICPACNTPKPGADPAALAKAQAQVSSTSGGGGFTGFGSGSSGGGFTGFGSGPTSSASGFKFGSSGRTADSSSGQIKFGSSAGSSKDKETKCADSSTKQPSSLMELLTSADDGAKPAAESLVTSTTSSSGGFGGFTFGKPGATFTFGGTKDTATSTSKDAATTSTPTKDTTAKSTTPFTFTPSSSTTGAAFSNTKAADSTSNKDANTKDTKSTPFNFTPSKPSSGGFVFGGENANTGFNFTPSSTPSKPLDLSGAKSPKSPGGGEEYYVNQDGDDSHIYFEPIVQLEKVEVKTGEEDEEVLFCKRAKCFRFDGAEWRERGLGEVKVLMHKETKKRRLIMRREQVHKLCLNHYLSTDLELKPMQNADGKAWVWHADDFTDNEVKHEQLAIRFKNKDFADEFHQAFTEAQKANTNLLTPVKKDKPDDKDTPTAPAVTPKISSAKLNLGDKFSKEKSPPTIKDDTGATAQVQSDQISSTDNKKTDEKPKSIFGSSSGFSFKPTNFPADSGKVFGTAAFGANPVFGGIPSFGTAKGFTFGTSGGSVFGSSNEASPKDSGTSPLNKGKESLLLRLLSQPSDPDVSKPISMSSDDDDVIFVGEKKATDEQIARARKLLLPDHFYLYEERKPCPGCLGCDDGEGKFVKKSKDDDVIYVGTDSPTPEQRARAKHLQLPPHFYMYEEKPACEGCQGCEAASPTKPVKSPAKEVAEKPSSTTSEGSGLFGGGKGSDFSFSSVAASSGGKFGFGQNNESTSSTGSKPFSWAGAGSAVFGASPGVSTGEEDDDGVVQSNDIHFEPIVAMPDEIEVLTGEEDEDVLYSQRSKLFRFDAGANQWKERGVGNIKFLRHKETCKIRVLMRRDQVLKIACNHALTADMKLTPLHTSETAWCWFALDIAEGEPRHEHFAIKFKTKEISEAFKEKFEECQAMLANSLAGGDNNVSPTTTTAQLKPEPRSPGQDSTSEPETSFASPGSAEYEEGEYEDYEDEEEEEEDIRPWFTKRTTMLYADQDKWQTIGMGDLEVTYDDDVNGARITMATDQGVLICNHIICREYSVQCNEKKKFCEWTAKDFSTDDPVRRTFRVQFSSKNAVQEFSKIFQQGRDLAIDSDLSEAPEYGVGGRELKFS